jgi:hypothetical protein
MFIDTNAAHHTYKKIFINVKIETIISENYFRIGFGLKDFPGALAKLDKFIKERIREKSIAKNPLPRHHFCP